MHSSPDPLGPQPRQRHYIIMHMIRVRVIGLVQLQPRAARAEDDSKREAELRHC